MIIVWRTSTAHVYWALVQNIPLSIGVVTESRRKCARATCISSIRRKMAVPSTWRWALQQTGAASVLKKREEQWVSELSKPSADSAALGVYDDARRCWVGGWSLLDRASHDTRKRLVLPVAGGPAFSSGPIWWMRDILSAWAYYNCITPRVRMFFKFVDVHVEKADWWQLLRVVSLRASHTDQEPVRVSRSSRPCNFSRTQAVAMGLLEGWGGVEECASRPVDGKTIVIDPRVGPVRQSFPSMRIRWP